MWLRELQPDDQGEDASDHKAEQAGDHVHDPDQLVVGGRQPERDRLPEGVVVCLRAGQSLNSRHDFYPSLTVTGWPPTRPTSSSAPRRRNRTGPWTAR